MCSTPSPKGASMDGGQENTSALREWIYERWYGAKHAYESWDIKHRHECLSTPEREAVVEVWRAMYQRIYSKVLSLPVEPAERLPGASENNTQLTLPLGGKSSDQESP